MNYKEYKDCKKHHNAILYKITSKCNDSCSFCLEYRFIKFARSALSFKEFKENYFYLNKRFKIDYIILTGGEPTLHSEFFDILEFVKNEGMGFRIITNLLKFNDSVFLERLSTYFQNFKNTLQEKQTKIIASINDPSNHSLVAAERMKGLKKALEYSLPLMISVVIYRANIKELTNLIIELKNIINQFPSQRKYHIEFRPMYIKGVEEFLLKKSLPKKFDELLIQIQKLILAIQSDRIILTFWNFPLCYLKNYREVENNTVKDRQMRRLIKVSKDNQLANVDVRNLENFLKPHIECKKCQLKSKCSGIDGVYIDRYNYPRLKPIFY